MRDIIHSLKRFIKSREFNHLLMMLAIFFSILGWIWYAQGFIFVIAVGPWLKDFMIVAYNRFNKMEDEKKNEKKIKDAKIKAAYDIYHSVVSNAINFYFASNINGLNGCILSLKTALTNTVMNNCNYNNPDVQVIHTILNGLDANNPNLHEELLSLNQHLKTVFENPHFKSKNK